MLLFLHSAETEQVVTSKITKVLLISSSPCWYYGVISILIYQWLWGSYKQSLPTTCHWEFDVMSIQAFRLLSFLSIHIFWHSNKQRREHVGALCIKSKTEESKHRNSFLKSALSHRTTFYKGQAERKHTDSCSPSLRWQEAAPLLTSTKLVVRRRWVGGECPSSDHHRYKVLQPCALLDIFHPTTTSTLTQSFFHHAPATFLQSRSLLLADHSLQIKHQSY